MLGSFLGLLGWAELAELMATESVRTEEEPPVHYVVLDASRAELDKVP